MIARGEVAGVITIQSDAPAAFKNEDVVSLRTVADQVATAVSNARLAQELQTRLHEMETLQRYYVREAWDQFLMSEIPSPSRTAGGGAAHTAIARHEYDQPGVDALGDRPLPEVDRVLAEPSLTVLEGEGTEPSVLVSPISLREQVLGVLGLHRLDAEPWTEDQIELVTAISEQMGVIIENSRLFAEAQTRAARERLVGELATRMRQTLDVESVLRTAAHEVRRALDLPEVVVRLGAPPHRAPGDWLLREGRNAESPRAGTGSL
jgi:GAF domain-containing protein